MTHSCTDTGGFANGRFEPGLEPSRLRVRDVDTQADQLLAESIVKLARQFEVLGLALLEQHAYSALGRVLMLAGPARVPVRTRESPRLNQIIGRSLRMI